MRLSRIRKVVQVVSLVTFLGLTLAAMGWGANWVPGTIFSRLDPLVGLASMIASRGFSLYWAAALITLVATIVLGRAWCGWVCPVGTLIDVLPGRKRTGDKALSRGWQLGKYALLAVVLGSAALGSLGPMILDPITIATRPLQEIIRPLLGRDAVAHNSSLGLTNQSVQLVALLSLLPLAIALGLNAVEKRFWCRNLCPLGGLLALVSLSPGIRRFVNVESCTSCGRCASVCPSGAIRSDDSYNSSDAACITCMSCVDECPSGACTFPLTPASEFIPPYMPDRRAALYAVGATGVSLAATTVLARAGTADAIMRPPSTSEERLAELCVRCGSCYAMCPTGVLRPSISFATMAGPWTPMLDKRPAYCTLNCNRCATACPTDAIHAFTEDEKLVRGLGAVARVHKPLCRAWGRNLECMKCQAVCPIAGALKGVTRTSESGRFMDQQQVLVPEVDPKLCIGCNLCAEACPVRPASISVPGVGPDPARW
jgi:polyferredoxin